MSRFSIAKVAVRTCCALALAVAPAQAQRVEIADLGPGPQGRLLQRALASAHRLIEPDTGWFFLRRGANAGTSLVILGRTAAISSTIVGDVIVVGGDLHVRPGAHISGRAVAIGGGVYQSARAIVVGGTRSFQDDTYDIARTPDGYRLTYRSLRAHASRAFLLPGVYGLRLPTYDRVNGASVPIGPSLAFLGDRGTADFLVTYRSDLGKFDPGVSAEVALSRRSRLHVEAQRGTFTNDAWIWSDFVNSIAAIGTGTDTRNYFRADRAELTVHQLMEFSRIQLEPFVGARAERAWTVGPALGEDSGPWSIMGRTNVQRMRRPNPAIADGRITSLLAGTILQWESGGVRVRGRTRGEIALDAPGDSRFTQLTSDLGVAFPTFGLQEYTLDVHSVTTFGVTTLGGAAPPQRFAYLGGSGTLVFLSILEQGGDELLHVEQTYSAPISKVSLGFLGIPTLLLRHRVGSAGIGSLPDFEQMLGLGVVLTFARAELQLDPASGKVRLSGGLSFSR